MSHDWKFGDWADLGGKRLRFVSVDSEMDLMFVDCNGDVSGFDDCERFVYLPDCTGWDWKPLEISYRDRQADWLKENGLKVGDKVKVLRAPTSLENGWQYGVSHHGHYDSAIGKVFEIEKIEDDSIWLVGVNYILPFFVLQKVKVEYRPFANAAEYEPFFDKVIARYEKGVIKPGGWKPLGYSDVGIYLSFSLMKYENAFQCLKFKDGTPFGVKVEG